MPWLPPRRRAFMSCRRNKNVDKQELMQKGKRRVVQVTDRKCAFCFEGKLTSKKNNKTIKQ